MNGTVRWLTPRVDPALLARWRVVAAVVVCGYVVVRAPVIIDSPRTGFVGIGVLAPLDGGLGTSVLGVIWVVGVAASAAFAAGRRTAWSGSLAAASVLVLLTHRSSQGQILWFDILMVLHLIVLAAAHLRPPDALIAGWALRLGALVTVVTYAVAGVAKLRIGGFGWITDGGLERHIAFSATRADVLGGRVSPLAEHLVDLGVVSVPLAVGVVLLELAAPVALLGRRWAWGWSCLVWVMHAVIAVSMFVVFHWPLLGMAFVPVVLAASSRTNVDSETAGRV